MIHRNILYRVLQTGLISSIICFGLTNLILTNNLVTFGSRISEAEKKSGDLRRENVLLLQQIATAKSLEALEMKAESAGFVKPTSIVFISMDQPVALR
jgi:hypothetical protein